MARPLPPAFALLGFCALALGALAQTSPDQIGPGDEYEREISDRVQAQAAFSVGYDLVNEAVRRRAQRDNLPEPQARVVVLRKLAAIELERGRWSTAEGYYNAAFDLAGLLEDADSLIEISVARARVKLKQDKRAETVADLGVAWDIAKRTGRDEVQVATGLRIVELLRSMGRATEAQMEDYFAQMVALPGEKRLPVLLKRAEFTDANHPERFVPRWREVADLAAGKGLMETQAEALDQLALHAAGVRDLDSAVALFRESDAVAPQRRRSSSYWYRYAETLHSLQRPAEARAALERGLKDVDEQKLPKIAADLHDFHATLLVQLGEPLAGYEALRRAQKLREQAQVSAVRVPMVKKVAPTPVADNREAVALAAARSALREAELAHARQRQRAALGLAAAGVLVAAALGLALFYKRRAARALALAKDAAELRAERTHWQMLRYQLNPHFLYNSLASLSGLIATDAVAARAFVGRLSDFCRCALQRAEGDLRTVEDEMQLLAAFLDLEQVAAGGALRVRFEIDPASRACRLPPLLLQPLVENALKYGDPTTGPHREIVLVAKVDGATLRLEVSNSGQWADRPPEPLPRPVSGLGLANVRERLARIGGGGAELAIATDQPGWVTVRITLPSVAAGQAGTSGPGGLAA